MQFHTYYGLCTVTSTSDLAVGEVRWKSPVASRGKKKKA
jgi:hypothetical protein